MRPSPHPECGGRRFGRFDDLDRPPVTISIQGSQSEIAFTRSESCQPPLRLSRSEAVTTGIEQRFG